MESVDNDIALSPEEDCSLDAEMTESETEESPPFQLQEKDVSNSDKSLLNSDSFQYPTLYRN